MVENIEAKLAALTTYLLGVDPFVVAGGGVNVVELQAMVDALIELHFFFSENGE